jgi:hypothetical protein
LFIRERIQHLLDRDLADAALNEFVNATVVEVVVVAIERNC